MQQHGDPAIAHAKRLVERLERLSADSYWAHQASGVRGAILRSLEQVEEEPDSDYAVPQLIFLVELGYIVLEKSARDLSRRV